MPKGKAPPSNLAIDRAIDAQQKAKDRDRLQAVTNEETGRTEVSLVELNEAEVRTWAKEALVVGWNANPLPLKVIDQYRQAHPQPLGRPGDEAGKVQQAPVVRCHIHRNERLKDDGTCPRCVQDDALMAHDRAKLAQARNDMDRGLNLHQQGQARDLRRQRLDALATVWHAEAELARLGLPIEGPATPTGHEADFFYQLHPGAPRPHPA